MTSCEICGEADSKTNPVHAFAELGFGDAHPGHIALCRSCVQRRELLAWPSNLHEGRRLEHALLERPEPLRGRYAYLGDAKGIHLMRLRPEWVEAHSAG